ncbi:hypothetical protein GH714_027224 [Hevea brasiliensis]|uniref:Uncharacterized protein n=1 Tax=Hevea brasiliensis TaxID=3981 RepID=A0A6A6LRQ2_HEVBR|nr:hypothetical protein GH714_027224 [Hevea brasiliensis]
MPSIEEKEGIEERNADPLVDQIFNVGTERKHKGLNFEENGSGKPKSGHVTKGQGKGKLGEVEKFNVGHVVGNLNDNAISKMVETGERIKVGGVNEKLEENQNVDASDNSRGRKRCGRRHGGEELVDSLGDNVSLESERRTRNSNTRINESRMEQFRDIARKNASRFAHFDIQEEEGEHLSLRLM